MQRRWDTKTAQCIHLQLSVGYRDVRHIILYSFFANFEYFIRRKAEIQSMLPGWSFRAHPFWKCQPLWPSAVVKAGSGEQASQMVSAIGKVLPCSPRLGAAVSNAA